MKIKIGCLILLLAQIAVASEHERKRDEGLATLRSMYSSELDDEIIVWYFELYDPDLHKTINALREITNISGVWAKQKKNDFEKCEQKIYENIEMTSQGKGRYELASRLLSNVPNDIKMMIASFSTTKERFNMHLTGKCWLPVFNYRNLFQLNIDKITVLQEKTTHRLLLASDMKFTELKKAVENEKWDNVFDNLIFHKLHAVPNFKKDFTKFVLRKFGKFKDMQADTYDYIYNILTSIAAEFEDLEVEEFKCVREYLLGSAGLKGVDLFIRIQCADCYDWDFSYEFGQNLSKLLIAVELGNGKNVNRRINRFGDTLFTEAIYRDDAELVKLFLGNDVDINQRDSKGCSPLMKAVSKSCELVALILPYGCDVNICDNNGSTPLMVAVREGKLGNVQMLLGRGADIDTKDDSNNTVIAIAEKICQGYFDKRQKLYTPAKIFRYWHAMQEGSSNANIERFSLVYREILDTLNLYKQNL